MQCPSCKTEMRIVDNKLVRKDGEIKRRMRFICRSKDCANYNKEGIPTVSEYYPVEIEDE